MKDYRGNKIKAGDKVIIANGREYGDSFWLQCEIINEITGDDINAYAHTDSRKNLSPAQILKYNWKIKE